MPSRKSKNNDPKSAEDFADSAPKKSTVLLAVTGMSPAVLTETVWALAREQPAIIPDQVRVISTKGGAQAIQRELLSSQDGAASVWQQLRQAILGKAFDRDPRLDLQPTVIVTIPNPKNGISEPLDDIRTPQESSAAADCILDEIRKVTFNDDLRLIASMAGGRKTMGALLYAGISLFGRAEDRLTHVLVHEPFDQPALRPKFYFPRRPPVMHELADRAGKISEHSSDKADPRLADVPFVRLRKLFPQHIGRFPGTFSALVAAYSERIESLRPPEIRIDAQSRCAFVNGQRIDLRLRSLALLAFLCQHALEMNPPFDDQEKIFTGLAKFLPVWRDNFSAFEAAREKLEEPWQIDEIKRQLSVLRTTLCNQGLTSVADQIAPRRGPWGIPLRVDSGKSAGKRQRG